MSDRNL